MHSFAISLLKACRGKNAAEFFLALVPSLSFCLFVSRSVFPPSLRYFIFASCRRWYHSVSSVFVNLPCTLPDAASPLIYSPLFFPSHFFLCLFSPLSASASHGHPERTTNGGRGGNIEAVKADHYWRHFNRTSLCWGLYTLEAKQINKTKIWKVWEQNDQNPSHRSLHGLV